MAGFFLLPSVFYWQRPSMQPGHYPILAWEDEMTAVDEWYQKNLRRKLARKAVHITRNDNAAPPKRRMYLPQ